MAKVFLTVSGTSVPRVSLNELLDVDTSGGADGYVLTQQADGSFALEQVAQSIFDLSDVVLSGGSIAAGSTLEYTNGQWTNTSPPAPTPVYDELSDLTDTTITTPVDDQFLRYDGNQWVNETVAQYHGRINSEAETLLDGATATVELYYTAQADGDGLHEDAQSDTPTSGYDIQRKLYYAEKAQADPDTSADWTQFTAIADNTTFANAKAALLAYLKERTGGTVPISLKMTWEEVAQAPSFTGLLNESYGSGAEAAYSTRRLNGNYSGDCMTIRRASDGTTQSIGFVGEEIDESAIETFCTGTTCTVQVWRDQSGNGNDATQTTAANQPTIYTGGQLVKEGGRLALDFDNDKLSLASTIDFITIGTVINFDGTLTNNFITSEENAAGSIWIGSTTLSFDGTGTDEARYSINGGTPSTYAENHTISDYSNNQILLFANYDSGMNSSMNTIGYYNVPLNYKGTMQEIILYNSDKSTDRTDIEGNISAYFQSAKLLDEQFGEGAEAAYSTRQLRRDQTDCMVIRRASDSTTQTIGFDSNGNIDEAAINTFCSGTTCTVYQWLDQSGNGNTATAAAPANEPTIYTGGALVKENGKVAVNYGTASDSYYLEVASYTSLSYQSISTITVGSNAQSFGAEGSISFTMLGLNTSPRYYHNIGLTGGLYLSYSALEAIQLSTTSQNSQYLSTVYANNSTASAYFNGTNKGSVTSVSGNSSYISLGYNGGTSYHNGNIQEVILYGTDKSSVRTSIESNIGDYFTQNTPLLDTYSGAAAAYSLRKLRTAYTGDAVEVYNGTSYADIGFNVFGELDTVALAAHCGSNDGFVSTWYDQAGSNDATQTTTSNMPKIYDGTTGVVTENGKPAVEFDSDYFSLGDTLDATNGDVSAYMVVNPNATTPLYGSYISKTKAADVDHRWEFSPDRSNYDAIGAPNQITGYELNQQHIASFEGIGGDSLTAYQDGTQAATVSLSGATELQGSDWYTLIGGYGDATGTGGALQTYIGTMQEIVVYLTDQSSNRTNIEDNINTFYNIY